MDKNIINNSYYKAKRKGKKLTKRPKEEVQLIDNQDIHGLTLKGPPMESTTRRNVIMTRNDHPLLGRFIFKEKIGITTNH